MSSGAGAVFSSEPHIVAAPNEYRLNSPPSDGISCMQFSPENHSKILAVSSWDSTVRIYDVGTSTQNLQRTSYGHNGPVLGVAFLDPVKCASGGLDCTVKLFDLNANRETVMGTHDKAVKCLEFCDEMGVLVTGSWDHTLRLWDPRTGRAASTHNQQERVYTMSLCGTKVVVGTAGRKVLIWDLRQMNGPEQRRDSSLKFQTRCIKGFSQRNGYVLSSIEGRVAVEYIDPDPEAQKRKYAFKCHRMKEKDQELIYPVNALAFHPLHSTFATGGSDALVNIWDPFNKKRLCQFHKYPTSISSLAFNGDGSLLAIGASYQYELPEDPTPIPKDVIFIRKVADQETKPKS